MRRHIVAAALGAGLAVCWTPACGFDLGQVESGSGAVGGKKDGGGSGALGGTWPGYGGVGGNPSDSALPCGDGLCGAGETFASCPADCHCGDGLCGVGETFASCPADCHCGDALCGAGETFASCPADCHCGDGTCNAGESCQSCPGDCPAGGTKDCYDNGLHANCCNGPNGSTAECLACNNNLGCPSAEYAAYCDRFNAGDNLWQKYHRDWVASQCGGTAESDGSKYHCTNASTCTTYTCPL